MKIDGEWDEPDWATTRCLQIVLRGADGNLSRPYMEVRFLHDDKYLYLALFTSDLDIRSDDAFDVMVGSLHERFYATGKLEPPDPEIKVVPEVDGTLDDKHKDEEWKLEIAIPLDKTGLAIGQPVDTKVDRCDMLDDAFGKPTDKTSCNSWHGQLSLQ